MTQEKENKTDEPTSVDLSHDDKTLLKDSKYRNTTKLEYAKAHARAKVYINVLERKLDTVERWYKEEYNIRQETYKDFVSQRKWALAFATSTAVLSAFVIVLLVI